MARTCVYLNVYDMYWLNEYASNVGVGVYHSGVEIYGIEYAYGGHPLPFSGIFENTPRDAEELGDNFKFRESILLGETDFAASEVKKMIQLMGEDYRGDRYHLIAKNCNHFTSALAKTLTGTDIPSWVNRLASISGSIPFLERWIPAEWLTPIALQQSLDEKSRTASQRSSNVNPPTRFHYGNPSTSTNGTSVGGASTASWKWFQRRASSTTTPMTNGGSELTTVRSAPNTARSVGGVSNDAFVSSTGQSLTKLWNSIRNIASSATDSCAPMAGMTAVKKSLDTQSRSLTSPLVGSPSSPSSSKTNGVEPQQRPPSNGQ